MRKGFTLVELSIVLVIIGLLIGGLLTAQSMIKTASLGRAIRDLQQYDIMVTTFKHRYNQFPGDSNLFSNPGDNNGLVHFVESFNVWNQLSQGLGIKNYKGADYPVTANPPTKDSCPQLDYGNKGTFGCLLFNQGSLVRPPTDENKNYFLYYYPDQGIGNGPTTDVFTPAEALSIDQKIDDGMPRTGRVYGKTEWHAGDGCVTAGLSYDTAQTGYYCSMSFEYGFSY